MRRLSLALLLLVAACGRTGFGDGPENPSGPGPDPTATATGTPPPAGSGQLDPTFGTAGVATLPLANVRVFGTALAPDGKILVAGSAAGDWVVLRFSPSGALDASFADAGVLRVDLDGEGMLSGFVLLADGGFVLAGGWETDDARTVRVRRWLPDATQDTTFAIDRDYPQFVPQASAVAIAPASGGDLLFAHATRESNNVVRLHVERVDASGAPVASWSGDGATFADLSSNDGAWPVGLAVDPQGRVVLAATVARGSQHDVFLARFDDDGGLDSGWQNDGTTELGGATDDRAATLAVHADSAVLVAGSTGGADLLCARLSDAGALDGGFGIGGRATIAGAVDGDGIYDALAESGGATVVAGAHDGRFTATRVRPDGSPDASLALSLDIASAAARAVALQSDGALVFAGDAPNTVVLARWIP